MKRSKHIFESSSDAALIDCKRMLREIAILNRISNKHVVRLYDMYLDVVPADLLKKSEADEAVARENAERRGFLEHYEEEKREEEERERSKNRGNVKNKSGNTSSSVSQEMVRPGRVDIFLVMEKCDYDLKQLLKSPYHLESHVIRTVFLR